MFKKETILSVVASVLISIIFVACFSVAKVNFPSLKSGSTTHLSGLTIEGLDTAGGDGFFINPNVATSTIGSQGVPVYWTFGGVKYAYVQVALTATSSIPCQIANPFGAATTTILSFNQTVTSGIVGTNVFSLSTTSGANGYGSSTPSLTLNHSIGTGAQDYMSWLPGNATTTDSRVLPGVLNSTNESTAILGPSQTLVNRISTSTAGTFGTYYSGTCSATFVKP